MLIPDLNRIKEEHEQLGCQILRNCAPLHPNPLLWKHYWRLFTRHLKYSPLSRPIFH